MLKCDFNKVALQVWPFYNIMHERVKTIFRTILLEQLTNKTL